MYIKMFENPRKPSKIKGFGQQKTSLAFTNEVHLAGLQGFEP